MAFAVDAGFTLPLGVALTSLARSHAADDVVVTILHDGLPPACMDRLDRTVAGDLRLRWRLVEPGDVAGAHYMAGLSRATLYRLLLPRLLPSELSRVIYLDCDVVVADSLRPLWQLDLGDHLVAAVRDANAPFAAGPYGTNWQALGLAPDLPMFNAGILVIPLDAWRAEEVSERSLSFLRTSTPRWGDQDALNSVLQSRWLELPARWNVQSPDATGSGLSWALWAGDVQRALDDPAVLHFNEADKPWNRDCTHPLREYWYDALAHSAWSGWDPNSSSRPLHRRVGARMKLAWRALTTGRAGLGAEGLVT